MMLNILARSYKENIIATADETSLLELLHLDGQCFSKQSLLSISLRQSRQCACKSVLF